MLRKYYLKMLRSTPPPGTKAVTIAQVLWADGQFWREVKQVCDEQFETIRPGPLEGDGLIDKAVKSVMANPGWMQWLMRHTVGTSSSLTSDRGGAAGAAAGPAPGKRPAQNTEDKQAKKAKKAAKKKQQKMAALGRQVAQGGGYAKQENKPIKEKDAKEAKGGGKATHTESGEPNCFAFNAWGCAIAAGSECRRGRHVCAKNLSSGKACGKPSPMHSCSH